MLCGQWAAGWHGADAELGLKFCRCRVPVHDPIPLITTRHRVVDGVIALYLHRDLRVKVHSPEDILLRLVSQFSSTQLC
jgi:hypothetical protein